jgi:hypothetical protein
LIFDQNIEKLPADTSDTSAGEPEEKAKSLSETPAADPTDSDGQKKRSPVTDPPTPITTPVRPIEQAKPASDPSAAVAAKQPQPTPAVSSLKTSEQAKPMPPDPSSSNSPIKVILPAESL